MSVFMLETSAVSSVGSSISSLASEIQSISSNVSGYDTSCEDGFDFSSAKSAIAQNVEACCTRIKNASSVLETVVSAHEQIQSSMKFSPNAFTKSSSASSSGSSGKSSFGGSSGSSGYSGAGRSSGSGGSGGSGGFGGGSYSGYAGIPVSGGVATVATTLGLSSKASQINEKEEESKVRHVGKVKANLKEVGYANANKDISKESKKLFSDDYFEFKDGYAKVDGDYVVACDSSIGNVGDLLQFTQKDGTIVHGVIGITTKEKENSDKLYFIVDDNSGDLAINDTCDNLITDNKLIENCGNIYDIRKLYPKESTTKLDNDNSLDTNLENSQKGVDV